MGASGALLERDVGVDHMMGIRRLRQKQVIKVLMPD
jgi:hypothetical protein